MAKCIVTTKVYLIATVEFDCEVPPRDSEGYIKFMSHLRKVARNKFNAIASVQYPDHEFTIDNLFVSFSPEEQK